MPAKNRNRKKAISTLRRVSYLALFFCLVSAPCFAKAIHSRNTAIATKGKVIDHLTKKAIPKAIVKIYDLRQRILASTLTDAKGVYQISKSLSPGVYTVKCQANGYYSGRLVRYLTRGKSYSLNFNLKSSNKPPYCASIAPSKGRYPHNKQTTITATYFDPNGYKDIKYVLILMNTRVDSKRCFYAYYNRNSNKLYLKDNSGKRWLGGFTPGSRHVIQNSYCILDCSRTTVSVSGSSLTVKWAVRFKPAFKGKKNIYIYVKDSHNVISGWQRRGIWSLNYPPNITSLTPKNLSTLLTGENLKISVKATDKDKDRLVYRYLLDNTIIRNWTASSNFTYRTTIQDKGRHTLKVQTRDTLGGVDTESVDIYIFMSFPKPE